MDSVKNNKIEIQKEFVKQYKNEIFPFLKGYEVLRKRLYSKKQLITWIPITITLIGWIICWLWMLQPLAPECLFMINLMGFPFAIVIIIAIICNYTKKDNDFKLDLKKNCLQKLLNAFGDITWTNNLDLIKNEELKPSELFADFDQRTTDDEFCGTYKDINFKICETTLLKEFSTGKNRSVMKIFSGIVLEFELNKITKAHTIVSTKGDLTARDNKWLWIIGSLGIIEPILKSCEDDNYSFAIGFLIIYLIIVGIILLYRVFKKEKNEKQKIILEDVKFGKKYHVYSQDQIEARCIVTPAFMEKFLNLRTAYGAKNAKCAFYGNKAMFAIATDKNLFEIGSLNKTLLEPETFKKLYTEISAIYDIIDYFKLDKQVTLNSV